MPITITARGSRHQLRVKHALLPKPFYFTFDSDLEARNYGEQLDSLLASGVVPAELLGGIPKGVDPLLIEVIRAYTKGAPITDSDDELLGHMLAEIVGVRVSHLTFAWADAYVRKLKVKRNIAPSTIRKRVGVLGRVIDWHLQRAALPGQVPASNVMRLLPTGYSLYTRTDAAALEVRGKGIKHDQKRNRRMGLDDERRIRAALAGEKHPDRERALTVDPAFLMLFELILDTGLRLREAYRLRADQLDLVKGLIHVEGSKGHRGMIKPRHVPIPPALAALLRVYCLGRIGLLFPFWPGTPEQLRRTSSRLSVRFGKLFEYAGVLDMTEHDLRHEATCRWVEMRNARGWVFSDIEVCRIMGWTDMNMMLRYASLRGEDLAARMV